MTTEAETSTILLYNIVLLLIGVSMKLSRALTQTCILNIGENLKNRPGDFRIFPLIFTGHDKWHRNDDGS